MKKLTLLLLLFSFGFSNASVNESLFEKANQAYKKGKFQDALSLYKKISESGEESPALYYNTGNTCYRLQQYPLAILYYERALKLDPGNDDILFNLKIANQKIPDRIEVMPKTFFQRWFDAATNAFSSFQWSIVLFVLLTIMLGCIAVYLFTRQVSLKKTSFWLSALLVLFFAVSVFLARKQYIQTSHQHSAVLFTTSVNVKSSPDEKGNDLFVLHAGTKVQVTDQLGEWREIRIANGAVGWVKAKDMELI